MRACRCHLAASESAESPLLRWGDAPALPFNPSIVIIDHADSLSTCILSASIGYCIARATAIVPVFVHWTTALVVSQVAFTSKKLRAGLSVGKPSLDGFRRLRGADITVAAAEAHHLTMPAAPSEKRQKLMRFENKSDVFKGDTDTLMGVEHTVSHVCSGNQAACARSRPKRGSPCSACRRPSIVG